MIEGGGDQNPDWWREKAGPLMIDESSNELYGLNDEADWIVEEGTR
jgi:hypothetical protein